MHDLPEGMLNGLRFTYWMKLTEYTCVKPNPLVSRKQ